MWKILLCLGVASLALCCPGASADDAFVRIARAYYKQKLYDTKVLELKILQRYRRGPTDRWDGSEYPQEVRARHPRELRNQDLSPSDLELVKSGKKLSQVELNDLASAYLAGDYWCWRDRLCVLERPELRRGIPKPVLRDALGLSGAKLYRMQVHGRTTYLVRRTSNNDNSNMLVYDSQGNDLGTALCYIELCAWLPRGRVLGGLDSYPPRDVEELDPARSIWPDSRPARERGKPWPRS